MYVMTPYTSLLVLENDDMYQQYKVERNRKESWAGYSAPKKIPVVFEPEPGQTGPDGKRLKPSAKTVLKSIALRALGDVLDGGSEYRSEVDAKRVREALDEVRDLSISFPAAESWGPARRKRIVDALEKQLQGESRSQDTAIKKLREAARSEVTADNLESLGVIIAKQEQVRAMTESWGGLPEKERALSLTDGISNQLSNGEPVFLRLDPSRAFTGRSGATRLGLMREGGGKSGNGSSSLLYRRPRYTDNERLFTDLLAYAPGMNTNLPDILAVLHEEALPMPAFARGTIDDGARKLLDRARAASWWELTFPSEDRTPAFTLRFNPSGAYSWERSLEGLRELVVCDGLTLRHLYPDLGVGARRTVSAFHRLDLHQLLPWMLPPPDDLALGHDVRLLDDHTVTVTRKGAADLRDKDDKPVPYASMQFVFGDGSLRERRLVEMPANKVLRRDVFEATGAVRVLDGDGKELHVIKATMRRCDSPNLKPDDKDLVVLPLPYRTRDVVRRKLAIENKSNRELRNEQALVLFAALVGEGAQEECRNLWREVFRERDDRRIGYYVLLAACGNNLDAEHEDVLGEHPHNPLALYLALHTSPVLRKQASQWAVSSGQLKEGFLHDLATAHALLQRWQSAKMLGATETQRQAERDRAFTFVQRNRGPFAWALLGFMQDRTDELAAEPKNDRAPLRAMYARLAEGWQLYAESAGLGYAARYEHARCLSKAGKPDAAQALFVKLHRATLEQGDLPPLDSDFRRVLLGDAKEDNAWSSLLNDVTRYLMEKKRRPALLLLARQCWELGDVLAARQMVSALLEGVEDGKERAELRLAAVRFLLGVQQYTEAENLLQPLLTDPAHNRDPVLWRLAAQLASQRDQPARALEAREKAMQLEYEQLPEVINLRQVRSDYERLLGEYRELTEAMATLRIKPAEGFAAKVIRTADRWRALDDNNKDACRKAAEILQILGDHDLGWDYLTTPLAQRPRESRPWLELARTLSRRGQMDLSDRAYEAAFAAEPTDAQILWDRAQHLEQAGQTARARVVLQQLADGSWQPRFQWIQVQARQKLRK
jgi:tetratricopeptide (TPR) repeat protein